jgi:hypothetical protein
MYAYTNITFTAKQKENLFKLYDMIISNGLFFKVIDLISEKDWESIQEATLQTIENIYKYKNSAAGIIELISTNYDATNMDLSAIQDKLNDPELMGFVKEIVPNLS